MKALNFSLSVICCLLTCQVENEALKQSLHWKSWHLSLFKISLRPIMMLLAYQSFIKSFGRHYKQKKKQSSLNLLPEPSAPAAE